MHVSEGSDSGVIPVKRPNNNEKPLAEGAEGRPLTKENTHQSSTLPTQSGERVSQGLAGVRRAAQARKGEKFTALLHHLTTGLLRNSFFALKSPRTPPYPWVAPAGGRRGLPKVSERLGHSSVYVTAMIYAHVLKDKDERETVRKWEEYQRKAKGDSGPPDAKPV